MYGVIRRYKIDPANFDEVVRRGEQGLVPQLSGAPGFVSYRVLQADNGDLLSVSLFEDRDQAEESARIAAGWVKENTSDLAPNAPEVTAGEVRVREVNRQEELHYGVMRRYRIDATNVDEIVQRAQSGFVPIVSKLPGFATYALLDAGSGTLVTLSGFRDEASADRSTQEAAGWVKENLAHLVPNAPEVTRAKIKLSKVR
jgi:heme-degrading monooxygenase HmoA